MRSTCPRRTSPPPIPTPTPAACSRTCTAAASGPCANTPASATPPNQQALQVPARAGADRPLRGLRPADADRLRRGPRLRRGRGGQGGRLDLQPARHADPARRHPAGQGEHQHDDQRAGRRAAGDGDRGGQAAGRAGQPAARHIQNDILKEYIARGTYIFPPAPSMRLITDIFRYCAARCPSGTRSRSAATTSARRAAPRCRKWPSRWPTASSLRRSGDRAGLDVDDFAPQLSFFFNATTTSSKRWPSSAPRAACGPRSCATASAPRTRSWLGCASTRRPAAARSPRSSRTTTSCA
jgi:hypothetical protein